MVTNIESALVLHVEDDSDDVKLLEYAFKQAGLSCAVQVVNSGQAAMDYLAGRGGFADRAKHPLPCLVLLDLKLPGVSGLEVLEWIRQQPSLRAVVVIVFTSSSRPEDIEAAYRLGANSYIVKPADVERRRAIAQHLKGWWLECNEFAALSRGQEGGPIGWGAAASG